jgi:hypothetical protein
MPVITFDQIDPGLRICFDVIASGAAVSRRAADFAAACCREALARHRAPQPRRP